MGHDGDAMATRPQPADYSFQRYLRAKRTVDDRALNRGVLETVRDTIAARERPRILELGAGVGTMARRMLDWSIVRGEAEFTLVDRDGDSLALAEDLLAGQLCGLTLKQEDFHDTLAAAPSNSWDLIVAHAVLDLVDVPALLPALWRVLGTGHFWFTINFDGETIFQPDDPLDASVLQLYHRSIDERTEGGGDRRCGRHLLQQIPDSGAELISAGSSDWVVFPRGGRYPDDEQYFLHHIIDTVDRELSGHAELSSESLARWVGQRHEQAGAGILSYVAHQLDVFGRATKERRP